MLFRVHFLLKLEDFSDIYPIKLLFHPLVCCLLLFWIWMLMQIIIKT